MPSITTVRGYFLEKKDEQADTTIANTCKSRNSPGLKSSKHTRQERCAILVSDSLIPGLPPLSLPIHTGTATPDAYVATSPARRPRDACAPPLRRSLPNPSALAALFSPTSFHRRRSARLLSPPLLFFQMLVTVFVWGHSRGR